MSGVGHISAMLMSGGMPSSEEMELSMRPTQPPSSAPEPPAPVAAPVVKQQQQQQQQQQLYEVNPVWLANAPRLGNSQKSPPSQRTFMPEGTRSKNGGSNNSPASYDYIVSVVILGDSAVGKTSLLQRYTYDTVQAQQTTTVGCGDLYTSTTQLGTYKIRVMLTDTAGQERFRALSTQQVREKHGMLLVFDVTRRETFDHVNEWYAQAQKHYAEGKEPLVVLIANKIDLGQARQVSHQEAKDYADAHNYWYYEMSALKSPVDQDIRIPINHFVAACFAHRVARASNSMLGGMSQESTKADFIQRSALARQVLNSEEERRKALVNIGGSQYGATDARKKLSAHPTATANRRNEEEEYDDVPNNGSCSC